MTTSFLEHILATTKNAGARDLLIEIHGKDQRPTSAILFLALVAKARGFLKSAGVKPGDRVALLAPNRTKWVACDLAILAEGAICVPLYSRQDPRELAVMVRDCAPALTIASDAALADALKAEWQEHTRVALWDEVFAASPVDAG